MILYLVQHGKALPEEVDPERPLSPEGRREIEVVAESLAKLGLKIPLIYHSGKTRAEQTARLIADRYSVDNAEAVSGLAPNDDVFAFADFLKKRNEDALVVGHLPHLGKLASLLTTGNIETGPVTMVNAGVLCLKSSADGYRIAWYLTPELCANTR